MIVGYIRTYGDDSGKAEKVQEKMIQRYAEKKGIKEKIPFFIDSSITNKRKRNMAERKRANRIKLLEGVSIMPGWETLMEKIIDGEVKEIIVDCKIRLFNGTEQYQVLQRLCEEYEVQIIEVGNDVPSDTIVYYESTHKNRRTSIPLKDIDAIYAKCSQFDIVPRLILLEEGKIHHFLDYVDENTSFVLVKNYQHIYRKVYQTLSMLKIAWSKSVRVISLEEGEIIPVDIGSKKNIAVVYDKARSKHEACSQQLTLDVIQTFIKIKIKWDVQEVYIDDRNSNSAYSSMKKRLSGDITLVVDTFGKLGADISMIVNLLRTGATIYSLKEGGLCLV